MNHFLKFISFIFVFSIPFYDFPPTFRSGIAVSGILAGILFIFFLIGFFIPLLQRENKLRFPPLLFLPFLFFISFYGLSFIVHLDEIQDPRSFNHVVFYTYTFFVYVLVPFIVIRYFGTLWFSKVMSIIVMIVSCIGFYEFFLYYAQGYNAYANFLNASRNVGFFGGFPRLTTTFFDEPSHFALFVVCMLPIIRFSNNKWAFYIAIVAMFLTFSASLFVGLAAAFLAYIPRMLYSMRKVKFFMIFILLVPVIAVVLYFVSMPLYDKLFSANVSASYRYQTWMDTIKLLSQSPLLGYGPASYYLFFPIGVFNWYLQVFLESGLLGIGSLLFLVLVILGAALRSQLPLASFSVIAFAVQMIGMNHYYIPGIWVLTAFLFVRIAERKFSLQKKSAFRLQPVHTA